MREGQKRVNVYIPDDLYSLVLNSEYNMTEAIITGLTKLLEPVREAVDSKIDVSTKEDSGTSSTELVVSLQNQIKILEEQLSKELERNNLRNAFFNLNEIMKQRVESFKYSVKIESSYFAAGTKAPDLVELVEVRAHFEGLQKLLEEKTKTIDILNREVEGLQKEVERLDMFAHYFKSVEVKQIEAPAAEKVKPWWRFW